MLNAIVMTDFRENFAKLILVQIRLVRTMVNVWSTGKIVLKKLNSLIRELVGLLIYDILYISCVFLTI